VTTKHEHERRGDQPRPDSAVMRIWRDMSKDWGKTGSAFAIMIGSFSFTWHEVHLDYFPPAPATSSVSAEFSPVEQTQIESLFWKALVPAMKPVNDKLDRDDQKLDKEDSRIDQVYTLMVQMRASNGALADVDQTPTTPGERP
jgi:hypothetical protein